MALSEQISRVDTFIASGTILAKTFVGFDGATCVTNAKSAGVSIYDNVVGDNVSVAVAGRIIMIAGGAVAIGDPIASDTNGNAVKATSLAVVVDSGATAVTSTAANGAITTVTGGVLPVAINGYARTSASASGDLIEMEIK